MPPGCHSDKSLHPPRDFPKKMPDLFLDGLAMPPSLPKEAGVAREGQDEWSYHMSSRLQSPEQSQEPESLPLDIQSTRRDQARPHGSPGSPPLTCAFSVLPQINLHHVTSDSYPSGTLQCGLA